MSQPQAQNTYYILCQVVLIHTNAHGESTEHCYDIDQLSAPHALQGKLDRFLKRKLPWVKLMRIENVPNGRIWLYTDMPLQKAAADRNFHKITAWLNNEWR